MRFIGLDAGSVSVKYVVLDEDGKKLTSSYVRHKGHPLKVAFELLKGVQNSVRNCASPIHPFTDSPDFSLSITGSAGRLIASVLGIEPVNELVAQAYATGKLSPMSGPS